MEVISAKVDKKTKEKMKRLPDVNWSEVIRKAISNKIREEELRKRTKPVDKNELAEAAKITDMIRAKHATASGEKEEEGWSSVEEIRKWRDARK